MKKVVIVGGGFAGLNLAKRLSNNSQFEVVLVDKNNYHFFPPLLYQVSTAFIEASSISYPFRRLFSGRTNTRFHLGELVEVTVKDNSIETTSGILFYDYLVLAMGTETNYFGNENIKKFALPMKNIDDALNLRNHILLQIECAIRVPSREEKEKYANIVISGGGPTGVEIAGMLAEMARHIVVKDYPEATPGAGTIYLVDGLPSLLAPMSKKSQQETYHTLKQLGVQIILNTMVKDYVNQEVVLADGKKIPTATLIWASGVIAREVKGLPEEAIAKGKRIMVDHINKVKGTANVFSIGDQCFQTTDSNYPNGHPQLAQVAIQQGKQLADNLKRITENKAPNAFSYFNKGAMAIIAKYKAVVDLPRGFIKGWIAWVAWLFVHLLPIAGFRNKVKLTFSWLWSFITNNPTLRLIIRPNTRS